MKCARCLWTSRLTGKKIEAARDAVTVYEGNALCAEHLGYRRVQKKEEAKDPWA